MKKTAMILLAGLLALATQAMAQTAPPPGNNGAPDPERLALARELMTALDMTAMMRGMFDGMDSSMNPPEDASPDVKARIEQLKASIRVGGEAILPEMLEQSAQIYARNLTTQELRATLDFYRSPPGHSAMQKMPQLMAQIMPLSVGLAPKMYDAAQADYCSHRTCDDQDEQMFSAIRASAPGN